MPCIAYCVLYMQVYIRLYSLGFRVFFLQVLFGRALWAFSGMYRLEGLPEGCM